MLSLFYHLFPCFRPPSPYDHAHKDLLQAQHDLLLAEANAEYYDAVVWALNQRITRLKASTQDMEKGK